jgi:threonine dehydrogenase-like Zn-dependent dehydrogenase
MLPKTTLAMVQTGPRRLEARELPMPAIDDDSAILRVEACGICGSDYEQFEGVDVGDRVAVETMLACHCCDTCLGGRYHLCSHRQIYSYIPLSSEPGLWGAYAQYMWLAPNAILHRMDPALPPELAVMFNPLGAGFRWAVEVPQTQVGDTVLILGPGQRGLASVVAARHAGAGKIIVTGRSADARKLEIARRLGADHTIDVDNEPALERIKSYTGGRGADVVVEVTSYATEPVRDALGYVRPGGTIVLAGVKGFKPVDDFVSDLIVLNEITIRGVIGVTSSGYRKAIDLIHARTTPLEIMLARQVEGEESIHSCLIPPV